MTDQETLEAIQLYQAVKNGNIILHVVQLAPQTVRTFVYDLKKKMGAR